MRNSPRMLPLLLLVLAPRLARAQQPVLTPERQSAIMEAGRLMNAPAEFVLHYRQELSLTGAQAASIEKLAAALRDSSSARMARRTREGQKLGSSPGLANVMEWSGPINEEAIRDAMRIQSAVQADIMIASARDRRLVAALLTPAQRTMLPQLQMTEMMKAARGGAR